MEFRRNFWRTVKTVFLLPVAYYGIKEVVNIVNRVKNNIAYSIGDDDEEKPGEESKANPKHDRFGDFSRKRQYDEEASRIRRNFDSLDQANLKNLKKIQRLAAQSNHLTQKYRGLKDEAGINYSARLHQEIENAGERLTPIYESWKKRRLTLGALLLAGTIGFCRGNYVKDKLIGGNLEASVSQQATTQLQPRHFQQQPELEEIVEVPDNQGLLPHEVTELYGWAAQSKYAIFMDMSKRKGEIYDLEERRLLYEFPFTFGGMLQIQGAHAIKELGYGETSPLERGSAYFLIRDIHSDYAYIKVSGTYSREIQKNIETRRHVSGDSDIYLPDADIVRIYNLIRRDISKTVFVFTFHY